MKSSLITSEVFKLISLLKVSLSASTSPIVPPEAAPTPSQAGMNDSMPTPHAKQSVGRGGLCATELTSELRQAWQRRWSQGS